MSRSRKPTDLAAYLRDISSALDNPALSAEHLKGLLNDHFYHQGDLFTGEEWDEEYCRNYPGIVALLLKTNFSDLRPLLTKLLTHPHFEDNLKKAFCDAVAENQLHWLFNSNINDIEQRLEELIAHGVKLSDEALEPAKKYEDLLSYAESEGQKKGLYILMTAQKLKNFIEEERQPSNNEDKKPDNEAKQDTQIEAMIFKLKFLDELRKHDKQFAVHRGWGNFFLNFFIGLTGIGLLLIACNKMITGNWAFFRSRKTEELAGKLEKVVKTFPTPEREPSQLSFVKVGDDQPGNDGSGEENRNKSGVPLVRKYSSPSSMPRG